ncbi:QcrA and Rieske domain-containing protein [Algoriphagus hitonicola]|uniref:Rieske [2Fe-2S] domain-containing protein n=1 Tax=Algoriphagus hitonicola TaxID=435880 RepID=A0A1I2R872_9BACT|nr:Rieske (2Fe-2S) protein [Algoriphagus hitonicola]SFG36213.1 Rieske [2Fe-2S] domain-containing protein [Algoriphagus hitonicola]
MKNTAFKSGSLDSSRRQFIEKSGTAIAMSLFGLSFFTACSDPEDQTPNTPPPSSTNGISISGGIIQINLDQQTDLKKDGSWLLIIAAQTLVVNVNGSYKALTSVCTHSACDRNWTFNSNEFTCTCHGSKFNTDGDVLTGPANRPLESFATRLNGVTLIIEK